MKRTVLKKFIAIFLMLITIGNVIAPTFSWALTSGPTAPEATSFEPVDTTDMINTITGDLAYNIPLLEVPGPAGSYPLSLSYHSGIQPNMDASWVGLGWTLNPGSISRLVNGLPDDMNRANSTDRTFWEGGSTNVNTYGVSFGIGNVATVGAGLSFAQDTYKGRGVGGYVSVGANISNTPLNVNASVGISPYGGGASYGVGVGVVAGSELNVSANVGLSFNSSGDISAGLSGGVGYGTSKKKDGAPLGGSLLGASISSSGGGVSMSAAGFGGSSNNSKQGKISTSTDDFQVDIPVYYGINIHIGHTYIRYWMDETESYFNYGSLFFPNEDPGDLSTNLYDAYHIQSISSLSTGDNPEKYLAGSFADYDQYSVNAQGLAGNIRPYHYLAALYSQDIVNNVNGTKQILGYNLPQPSGVRYNFTNDFSNRVIYNAPDIQINPDASLNFPLAQPTTGNEQDAGRRYVPEVAGSKHVEYFTADDINSARISSQDRGFLECTAAGFSRDNSGSTGQVGAFSITNSSGVTYHFSLPAYTFDENVYSQNKDVQKKISFNNLSQKGKYAYTWYLTGVTGPDYVDRGPHGEKDGDGIINDNDWGYWVDFQYGKWADDYRWRNPSEGFNPDLDNTFQTFSKGSKEVYYLNAIRTKTHTALFVKELRADGKGESSFMPSLSGGVFTPLSVTYPDYLNSSVITGSDETVKWADSGNFAPQTLTYQNCDINQTCESMTFSIPPTPVLRLKSILLFSNENVAQAQQYNNLNAKYNKAFRYPMIKSVNGRDTDSKMQTTLVLHGENVLDSYDITDPSFPSDKTIREIDFIHDYSLGPGTSNSFDLAGEMYNCTLGNGDCTFVFPSSTLAQTKLGKLTLNSLTFKGKNGTSLVPPMEFHYDYRSPLIFGGNVDAIDNTTNLASISGPDVSQFSVGDVIKFNQQSNTYYGFIKAITPSLSVRVTSTASPTTGMFSGFQKTKNPEYNKDLYDMWGMYKSDFQQSWSWGIHDVERLTTPISAQNTDVWSLREIESSLGSTIKIQYESDTYSQSIFSTNISIPLTLSYNTTNVTDPPEGTNFPLYMEANFGANSPVELDKLFTVGDEVSAIVVADFCVPGDLGTTCSAAYYQTVTVQDVSGTTIRVRAVSNLYPETGTLQFIGGIMQASSLTNKFGGGVRVASVGVDDEIHNQTRFTTYTYEFNQLSSGYTSYEPLNIQHPSISQYQSGFDDIYYNQYLSVLSMARELPSPAVYYGKVRLGEKIIDGSGVTITIPSYTDYEFEALDVSMIRINSATAPNLSSSGKYRGQPYQSISRNKITLKDYLQRMGQLRSIATYNDAGVKISETINHYLHDQQTGPYNNDEYMALTNQFSNQGVIQETFNHGRWVNTSANDVTSAQLQGLISKKESYPVVQTGTTNINYKSGIKTETKNLAFDFYNGSVTQSLFSDGYGNNYLTTTVPAYHYYPDMGLKMPYSDNIPDQTRNKHMIDQVAYTKTEKISTDPSQAGIVSASAQTWSSYVDALGVDLYDDPLDGWRKLIWRKQTNYSFVGDDDNVQLHADGLFPKSSFFDFDFNWGDQDVPAVWQKNGQITLYDIYSHALEASDINENYAATRMTMDQTRVSATASNCRYREIGYTGAEETPVVTDQSSPFINFPTLHDFGGGILGTTSATSTSAHTGKSSLLTQSGLKGFVYFLPTSNIYHVSFWSTAPDATIKYQLDGASIQSAVIQNKGKAGDWYLLEADINVTTNISSVLWCEAGSSPTNFDDFRVHPLNSSMTSYVYNSWGELSHILNANNLFTNYTYDNMGRLTGTSQETFSNGVTQTSTTAYHYANH